MSYLDAIGALPERAIVIRVKNADAVVKQKGGALGNLAETFAPEMTAAMFYDRMRNQLADGLRQQGVDADVSVVPAGQAPSRGVLPSGVRDFGIGVGAGVVAGALVRWLWSRT